LRGGDAAGNDVIGEDGDEFLFIFRLQQIFDGAGGKFGEGVVGGGEDGEWTLALERVGEVRVLNEPAATAVSTMSFFAAGAAAKLRANPTPTTAASADASTVCFQVRIISFSPLRKLAVNGLVG
jgi:hypothetical protein